MVYHNDNMKDNIMIIGIAHRYHFHLFVIFPNYNLFIQYTINERYVHLCMQMLLAHLCMQL